MSPKGKDDRGFSPEARAAVPVAGFGPGGRHGGPGSPGGPMRSAIERVRPKKPRETMSALFRRFRPELPAVALTFLVTLAETALVLAAPTLVARAVDAIALASAGAGGPGAAGVFPGGWRGAALALLGTWICVAALAFAQQWIMASSSQRVVRSLRGELFSKFLRLPVRWFDERPIGDAMSRVANDVDSVSSTLSQSTVQLMANVVTVAGAMAMMLVTSPPLALVTLCAAPLVFLLTRAVVTSTRPLFREQQATLGELNGMAEETFSSLEVTRAFGREREALERFERANARLEDTGAKAQIRAGFLMPMMNVINNLTFASIALVGGALALSGAVGPGTIAAFLGYSRLFVRPLNEIANVFNVLMASVAGAERVFETLDEREEEPDPPDAVELADPRGEVEFRGVRFGYRSDVPVIDDASFVVPAGATVALVGPTGAGKTTLANLLVRFYDPDSGAVLVDGIDVRRYARASLRRAFGMVLQDTPMLPGTIAENVAYGSPDATKERIALAADLACATHFVERLPDGFDTDAASFPLSHGQRQLVAIARVACREPALLVLDEATSSVDTRTEVHVRRAMTALARGRTCFVIAHRLSTIREADLILVVDGGRIVERGTHEELMALGGSYRRMFEAQRTGDYEEAPER